MTDNAWARHCPEAGACGPQCTCADEALAFTHWIDHVVRPRYFRARELLVSATRNANTPPPRHLWGQIAPTLVVADELRHRLGVPLQVTSAYRSPAYNARVGGARRSQHLAFRALDLAPRGATAAESAAMLRTLRGGRFYTPIAPRFVEVGDVPAVGLEAEPLDDGEAFIFRGGIGEYSSFVHVDTRGVDADWRG